MTESLERAPLISVIVPVYGVEAFLPACIDSLLAQTLEDFELLLVDDGSPDGCGRLCDEAVGRDARVRVIHRQNGGLSAARNSGLAAAGGRYVAFVDSDDLVHPDYLKSLYEACAGAEADMALCAVEDVTEAGAPLPERAFTRPAREGVFPGRELLSQFFGPQATCYTVAWNKLYKAELWRALRYPEGLLHEDDAVAHLLYWNCAKVACVDRPLYFYRLRQGSICRTGLRPGHFDGVSAHAAWCRFFAGRGLDPALLDQALAGAWRRYLALCAEASAAPLTWPLAARWHAAQAEMRGLLPLLKGCSRLSLKEKFSARRWAQCVLALPPKTEKPRVALLLPPGLPVPAVKGGAVEGLVTLLAGENRKQGQLELAVVCQGGALAAAEAARYPGTLFYHLPPESRSRVLIHGLARRAAALAQRPLHWNGYYAHCLPFLKRLDAGALVAEGGDLNGWQQASRALGRERFWAHLHGAADCTPALDKIYAHTISISSYVRQRWLASSSLPCASAHLLLNCVPLEDFSAPAAPNAIPALRLQYGFSEEDFVVLFCGRLAPDKGVDKLVEAVVELQDPAVKLLIVGEAFFAGSGPDAFTERLHALAAPQSGRIVFAGYLPNRELPLYYQAADLTAVPSVIDEAAGLAAVEAMAAGCPVLATASGGLPEYLEGSGAELVERGEDLAFLLAQAIRRLKGDPGRRAVMAAAGRARAQAFGAARYYADFVRILARGEGPL